jgi:hypothetical protein
MTNMTRSLSEIVDVLHERCGLRSIKLDPQLVGVEFDALLVGPDPLSVVAVEYKKRVDEKTLHQSVRKAQSFAWSTFTNRKIALLNLILLLPSELTPEALQTMEKELSGTARLFVITEHMPYAKMEQMLSLLAAPRIVERSISTDGTPTIETVLNNIDARTFNNLAQNASSAEDLQSKLLDVFQSLISEVKDAAEKS